MSYSWHRGSVRSPSLLIRVWTSVWMLAVPLFHIHHDIHPHHGHPGHVQVAAVHTVFSPDLEGEFGPQAITDNQQTRATDDIGRIHRTPTSSGQQSEFAFSVLTDSPDRKCSKSLSSSACATLGALLSSAPEASRLSRSAVERRSTSESPLRHAPPRAPPTVLL